MMITGVPKKERWWLWAFAVWIFFSLGPGLEVGSQPVFFGYFPALYVWSFVFWLLAIGLACCLAYCVHFHDVPTDIKSIQDEKQGE
ncbi:MAG: hypothetical protein LBU06_04315 [Desulfovibrio sp.]|nr:hypothetical protein [Desulfovibrio sp.]